MRVKLLSQFILVHVSGLGYLLYGCISLYNIVSNYKYLGGTGKITQLYMRKWLCLEPTYTVKSVRQPTFDYLLIKYS